MTLADMSLFDIAMRAASIERAVTVTMNAEFVGPGRIGEFIEATGELVKEGGSLLFLRGDDFLKRKRNYVVFRDVEAFA